LFKSAWLQPAASAAHHQGSKHVSSASNCSPCTTSALHGPGNVLIVENKDITERHQGAHIKTKPTSSPIRQRAEDKRISAGCWCHKLGNRC